MSESRKKPKSESSITPLSLLQSIVAGFFGIQKESNRQRDFESGNFWYFIGGGIVFVILFMLLVWAAVQYLIATT
ncbi:MAG: DUF2970 domain-containing protein [Pseudomonadota bacterium]